MSSWAWPAGETTGTMPPSQSILDKNKDLGNYDKHLPLRDCFLAGLLISGLTKEKYNTTVVFALARVVMAQPQWPANVQTSLQLFYKISFQRSIKTVAFYKICWCNNMEQNI